MTQRRDFLKWASLGLAGGFGAGIAKAAALENAFNVKAFGAKADGKTLDTPAINQAIEAAMAAGGGTVLIPAGNYLCFSIHLKSNVALYLDEGATIVAADTPEGGAGGYDAYEPNTPWDNTKISATPTFITA